MISTPILGLGLLVGMQHALEADHIAAVSSIAARETRTADIVKHGLTWGLGHTLTLFSFAGAAIVLGWAIPEMLTQSLEAAVGVMLVGLGAHVLWRQWRERVNFHRHRDATQHIRAQVTDPMQGVAYVVLFGLGSMVGMGALSSVIAVPLVASARLLTWMNRGLRAAIGLVTVGIGATTIYTILAHA